MLGDLSVSSIAFGGAGLTFAEHLDDARREELLRVAVDAGFTLIDTALAYSTADERHHNERLVARALGSSIRDGSVTVISKGGHYRDGDRFPVDGRPEAIAADCRGSLEALGVDAIDLYLLHKTDPEVPLEESVGALAALREQGLVKRVGVSNVSRDELRRAQSVTVIDAVENRLDLSRHDSWAVLSYVTKIGMPYLAYSPLSVVSDWSRFAANEFVRTLATERGASPQQLVLAWLLVQGATVIPITGATREETIRLSAAASEIQLTAEQAVLLGDEIRASAA
ncbi:aldo/keto reductase [Agreia sp. PsM10]|uniref:aldo/keto reductase n=1 Tax=Agreia sp. PsM10 TaxID=3030533 RepID=UPI00263B3672|nr:aldo/keto reductase [Agreia sp. PsM10]MDN4639902.1 aldo/keto reductase [Agreia sp. PsM10]